MEEVMNSELFELCKEVYERTEWETKDLYYLPLKGVTSIWRWKNAKEFAERVPLYTSDYLLEKGYVLSLNKWVIGEPDEKWKAKGRGIDAYADTPLKALLKLVIALYDAGVKL